MALPGQLGRTRTSASEGEWPIFSKYDKAMLKSPANREFRQLRFLHLPAEIRHTLGTPW